MAIIDTIENFEVRQPQQGVTIPYGNQLNGNTQEIVDKVNEVVLEVNTITGSDTGLDSKTDKGGYTGTSKDLKDLIDLKQNITITEICTTATGSYTIPEGLPIGTKRTYRKVNATQGNVTISARGSEKITPALLSSVSLNADGDFWVLKKVSETRWDLVGGKETGSNSNGEYYRDAIGNQLMYNNVLVVAGSGVGYRTSTWTYPKVLSSKLRSVNARVLDYGSIAYFRGISGYNVSSVVLGFYVDNSDAINVSVSVDAIGRWY